MLVANQGLAPVARVPGRRDGARQGAFESVADVTGQDPTTGSGDGARKVAM